MQTHKILSPDALGMVAEDLLKSYPEIRIFAFFGPMGVGKTTFIKAICTHLGCTDLVNSPTFSIVNHYHTPSGQSIFHFDFYRIQNLEEVFNLGYEDYFFSGAYCFIEWSEKVEPLLPAASHKVFMQEINGERTISF